MHLRLALGPQWWCAREGGKREGSIDFRGLPWENLDGQSEKAGLDGQSQMGSLRSLFRFSYGYGSSAKARPMIRQLRFELDALAVLRY